MMSTEIKQMEEAFLLDVYPKRDLVLASGNGSILTDHDGRQYIDCATSIGVSALGYANTELAQTLYDQYMKLPACYSMFYHEKRALLAEKLVSLAPGMHKVFFCNSGTESIEGAIKFARATTHKEKIVCAMRGFHGKTMGSLGATWDAEYKKPFMPMLNGFMHVPFNSIDALQKVVDDTTAAILVEIIQGEGGIRLGDKAFFEAAKALCNTYGCLLIIDEVQTFGRTGQFFAYEELVHPDIVCIAKAVGSGFPMGAILCTNQIAIPKKSHTSTFGGNPLACAMGLKTIEIMEREKIHEHVQSLGRYIVDQLRNIHNERIKEVRGKGLMIGIELTEKAGPFVQLLKEKGILVLLAGNFVIRLLPPLIITKEEIDQVIQGIKEVLHAP